MLERAAANPILKPLANHPWESDYVFNTAALFLAGRVHLVYRAIGHSGLSVFGYAASQDGIHIDERLKAPIYICRGPHACKEEPSKRKHSYSYASGGSWSGCEDPRLTRIADTIFLTYTAFNGWSSSSPGIALTSISVDDFLHKRWHWDHPKLLSPPNEMHKNWVLFPEKINGKYAILHSISPNILIDYFDNLDSDESFYVKSHYSSSQRDAHWDTWVRGIGPPPIKTNEGWLVLYHAMDKRDPNRYKIGAMLLDTNDPTKILYRSASPLLEPDANYENEGFKPGVIYSCGAVVMNETLYVYYGAADSVVCVATADLNQLLEQLKNRPTQKSLLVPSPKKQSFLARWFFKIFKR
jgi:predicted GH43/DUF377 family glycosyl hydrolase